MRVEILVWRKGSNGKGDPYAVFELNMKRLFGRGRIFKFDGQHYKVNYVDTDKPSDAPCSVCLYVEECDGHE